MHRVFRRIGMGGAWLLACLSMAYGQAQVPAQKPVAASGAPASDTKAGERAFRQYCRACHAIGPRATNHAGPALNQVVGHKAGQVNGFDYSAANKKAGIVWTEDSLVAFILDPQTKLPGTRKKASLLKQEDTIRAIYRYLQSEDGKR